MNLRELKLVHFRNYQQAAFSFEEKAIHVLAGRNAQGKTNLIEAIYLLAYLRSFRLTSLDPVKMHGEDEMCLQGIFEKKGQREKLTFSMQKKQKKLYDGENPVRTFSSFVGKCNAILFCPDDLMLFSMGPARRRAFLDMELCKLDCAYTADLANYQKLLRMRAQCLKEKNVDCALLDVYTQQMIPLQESIMRKRHAFISRLSELLKEKYPFFSASPEEISLEYKTFADPEKELPSQLNEIYKKNRERELLTRNTAKGIHKDDLLFFLNGIPLLESASQGQKRSVLLALKLALCEIIYETAQEYPILLLDDVFSELDAVRRKQFIEQLPAQMQVFITTAEDFPDLNLDRKVIFWRVEEGTLKKEEGQT